MGFEKRKVVILSPTLTVFLRFLWYLLSRLLLAGVVVGLVLLSFFAAMDYMNVQVLVKDGLNLRADVIIKGDDPTPMSKVFSKGFLEEDTLLNSVAYQPYIVSDYDHSAHIGFVVIFPWNNIVMLRVTEEVANIKAEVYIMADSETDIPETPPDWDNAVYDIKLMRYEDNWRIVSMELVELLPKPSPTPKPSPSPTPTPTPEELLDPDAIIED